MEKSRHKKNVLTEKYRKFLFLQIKIKGSLTCFHIVKMNFNRILVNKNDLVKKQIT